MLSYVLYVLKVKVNLPVTTGNIISQKMIC
jgi:hypothetical protein